MTDERIIDNPIKLSVLFDNTDKVKSYIKYLVAYADNITEDYTKTGYYPFSEVKKSKSNKLSEQKDYLVNFDLDFLIYVLIIWIHDNYNIRENQLASIHNLFSKMTQNEDSLNNNYTFLLSIFKYYGLTFNNSGMYYVPTLYFNFQTESYFETRSTGFLRQGLVDLFEGDFEDFFEQTMKEKSCNINIKLETNHAYNLKREKRKIRQKVYSASYFFQDEKYRLKI